MNGLLTTGLDEGNASTPFLPRPAPRLVARPIGAGFLLLDRDASANAMFELSIYFAAFGHGKHQQDSVMFEFTL